MFRGRWEFAAQGRRFFVNGVTEEKLKARRWIAFLVVAVGVLVVGPATAQGAFGIKEWSAITCTENEDTPKKPTDPPVVGYEPLPEDPGQCNTTTESKWFTQAAGHPNFAYTDFTLNTLNIPGFAVGFPDGFVEDIVVDTPEGLSVNPEAVPKCTVSQLQTLSCPPASLVGINYFTVNLEGPKTEPAPVPCAGPGGNCLQARVAVPVYNLVPFDEVPSMVGFMGTTGPTFIVGSLDPVDQHVTFTISDIHSPKLTPGAPPVVGSRLVFNGRAGNGTYLTMPSNCAGGQTTTIHVDSHEEPPRPKEFDEESFTTTKGAEGCDKVPFDPTIDVQPQGDTVDSPLATEVKVGIPFDPTQEIANSYLKEAEVTLPEGMSLNPASANGLVPCTDAQFAKGTNDPIACPDASRIGTVEVQTPSLPADSLTGTVYVGQPLSNDSSTGEQFRIFIHAGSRRYAVNVRLEGKVYPDPQTGQLTVFVGDNPQATFSSFKLRMNGGSKGTLTSPPTCGPNETDTILTPWSGQADAKPTSTFTLTSDPAGGPCPTTLAGRRFAPGYSAKSDSPQANAYSPFRVHIGRQDGEQELKKVDVTLPKGLAGKIAGIPYCADSALAAAATKAGSAEAASPSCSSASQIGVTHTSAGSGNGPIRIDGKAYLAGPYKGAPLSMAVITPAVAGPYDLGTTVVRVALNVNPESAQITANSDAIPDILGGVRLDIRSIDVDLDRAGFTHNPTSCASNPVTGSINGGGGDPAVPAAWSTYPVYDNFAVTDCEKLGFKPVLKTKLLGGRKATKRKSHPSIRAILTTNETDANIARTAVTLPPGLLLDNAHVGTVCTRADQAANTCPAASIYGKASAKSPLLDGELSGNVYLVPSSNKLPDLLVDLRGQIDVQLRGVIGSSKKAGLRTVFSGVPDAPVSRFVLTMDGGKKGLLINSKDLCKVKKKKRVSALNMTAQNGKQLKNNKLPLQISGCPKKKGKKK